MCHSSLHTFLQEAERLEQDAASQRVAYYEEHLGCPPGQAPRLLDIGCGNGYSVSAWREEGLRAIGLDRSLYRLSRWVAEKRSLPLLVADAKALPFRSGTFSAVVSSGMIEHIGVDETSQPYTAQAQPNQSDQRARAIAEMVRVASPEAQILVDCPNGGFPVDFWHGDRIGSFRVHKIPDELNPTWTQLRNWASQAEAAIESLPIKGRLSFRQIRNRWWGKVLLPLAKLQLEVCDLLIRWRLFRAAALLQPFLAVRFIPLPRGGQSAGPPT